MEYAEPKKVQLKRLLLFNRFLTVIFIIVLIPLCIFFFKFFLLAMISVEKSGIRLESVIDIIKYHFIGFINSFGELTSKYMLFATLILLINVVGILLDAVWKVFRSRKFYFILFFISVIIGFVLPINKTYETAVRIGKPWLMLVCILTIIGGPYLIGYYLGKDAITNMIYRKIIYILVFGLLLTQLFLEW